MMSKRYARGLERNGAPYVQPRHPFGDPYVPPPATPHLPADSPPPLSPSRPMSQPPSEVRASRGLGFFSGVPLPRTLLLHVQSCFSMSTPPPRVSFCSLERTGTGVCLPPRKKYPNSVLYPPHTTEPFGYFKRTTGGESLSDNALNLVQ